MKLGRSILKIRESDTSKLWGVTVKLGKYPLKLWVCNHKLRERDPIKSERGNSKIKKRLFRLKRNTPKIWVTLILGKGTL